MGGFRVGEIRGGGGYLGTPEILVPCVRLREPQSLGCTADAQNNLLGYTMSFFGIRTSIETDPDMHQYLPTEEIC